MVDAQPETRSPVGGERIEANHLILCEGKDDLTFLRAIISRHAIPDTQVMFTGNGDSAFGSKLTQLIQLGQLDLVSSVLLVGDNDTNPPQKFRRILSQVRAVSHVPVPVRRLQIATRRGQPSLAVAMIPWRVRGRGMDGNRPGNIETLILDVMKGEYADVAKCVESFFQCVPNVKDWDISPQSKMRLSCLIAATCKRDPDCPPLFMWQSNKKFQHLLDEPLFKPLIAYLTRLSKRVNKERAERLKLSLGLTA